MKHYNQAPLPFQGQKRRFLKQFKEALKQAPANSTYVDLFGGSGLLSHTVKQSIPQATVVYNDYDGYSQRIANIDKTNTLLADIRAIATSCSKQDKMSKELKEQILNRIAQEKDFVDYITISTSLLFSGNYVTSFEQLQKQSFYNTLAQNEYNAAGYLEGVDIVKKDYSALFADYSQRHNVVFLVDPPYLSTEAVHYSHHAYWKLSDYLNVLDTLLDTNYFYFTSNKSSILELCEWMGKRCNFENPFKAAHITTIDGRLNYKSCYTDIMVFKLEQVPLTL